VPFLCPAERHIACHAGQSSKQGGWISL
jgi:hypothetical protein